MHDAAEATNAGASYLATLLDHLRAVVIPYNALPFRKLSDLHDAVACLADKSKSFYTSSFVFEGRLQLDLLAL